MRSTGGITFVVAALIFLASAAAFGASVVNALRVEEVPASSTDGPGEISDPEPEAGPPSGSGGDPDESPGDAPDTTSQEGASRPTVRVAEVSGGVLRGPQYPQVSYDELLQAVNGDVFQPDRTPPVQRYLLPSEREAPTPRATNNRRRREPDLRIVGTAIAGDLALAMVQPDDSIPFAVLQGESVDGFVLASIDEESVTLTRDGDEFVYPVREPQRGRSSNNRRGNDRNQNAEVEAARALSERLQQMLQGARGQMMRRGGGSVELPAAAFYQNPRGGNLSVAVPITARGGRPGGGGGGGEDSK
jgi:hypothetical protein